MYLVKINEGQVVKFPYTLQDLRNDNPNTSFPESMSYDSTELLASFDVYPVKVTDTIPNYDKLNEILVLNNPTLVNGEYISEYSVVQDTPENIQTKIVGIRSKIDGQITQRLNTFAYSRGYETINSAAGYSDSHVTEVAVEGKRAKYLRDETWRIVKVIEAEVLSGTRSMPTDIKDIESELPELSW